LGINSWSLLKLQVFKKVLHELCFGQTPQANSVVFAQNIVVQESTLKKLAHTLLITDVLSAGPSLGPFYWFIWTWRRVSYEQVRTYVYDHCTSNTLPEKWSTGRFQADHIKHPNTWYKPPVNLLWGLITTYALEKVYQRLLVPGSIVGGPMIDLGLYWMLLPCLQQLPLFTGSCRIYVLVLCTHRLGRGSIEVRATTSTTLFVICQPACFFSLAWFVTFGTRFFNSVSKFCFYISILQIEIICKLVYNYIENIWNWKKSSTKAM